jgi:hypothetical protein
MRLILLKLSLHIPVAPRSIAAEKWRRAHLCWFRFSRCSCLALYVPKNWATWIWNCDWESFEKREFAASTEDSRALYPNDTFWKDENATWAYALACSATASGYAQTVKAYGQFLSKCSPAAKSLVFRQMIFTNSVSTHYKILCVCTGFLCYLNFTFLSAICNSLCGRLLGLKSPCGSVEMG